MKTYVYKNLKNALKRDLSTQLVKILQYFHFTGVEKESRDTLLKECDIVRFNNFIKWDRKIKAYMLLIPTPDNKYRLNPIILKKIEKLLPLVYAKC